MSPTASGALVFAGVAVFDGRRFLRDQTVVVADGRIVAAGASAGVESPAGSRCVPGERRTLLPGFVDAHVHLCLHDPARVLARGVTAARDLGWPQKKIFPLVERLAVDPDAGPLLLAAGPMLTAAGGYPARAGWGPRGTAREIGSTGQAISAVRELAAHGAAVVKVAQEPRSGPTLDPEVLAALVHEAHRQGLRVTSHCGSLEQLELALATGVDELAHGLWSDEEIPSATLERMVGAGMVVVPTLHIDPSAVRIANLSRFLAAGGRVVYGTDMGNVGPPPGIDPVELQLMVRAGMGIEDALAAATSEAADHVGLEGRGRVVPGAVADLVLVDGDPATDLSVLARPHMVVRQRRAVP